MTETELNAIELRAAAATPGTWGAYVENDRPDYSRRIEVITDNGDGGDVIAVITYRKFNSSADAEFIAHARSDVPALVAEVRRLRGLNSIRD